MQPHPGSNSRSNPDEFRLQTATQLLHLIKEEAEVLQRFDGQTLLQILPRKECLIRMLQQRMLAGGGSGGSLPGDENRSALRACLREIQEQNDRNRRFIEHSLAYWRDLVGLLAPTTYGRTGSESAHPYHLAVRGARINREA